MRRDLLIVGVLGLLLGLVLAQVGFFDSERLLRGVSNLLVLSRDTVPPDLGILPLAGRALVETLQIAFAGTLLGFILALPLGTAGARHLFPGAIAALARLVTAAIRTVPALLWAIVFVILVGLGPLAGTLGIALYTVGYLAKLYTEQIEGTDPEVLEAVRGVGASTLQLVRFAVFPESANVLLSQLLFMLEYNVRASSIMGFVGAGGIGLYLQVYIQTLEYQRLATLLLLILALVIGMDFLSAWVRRRFLLAAR